MGPFGSNFTNPLDFTSFNDDSNFPKPPEALPNFGVDLANSLDSGIANQLSSPFGSGNDSSGQSRTGGVMDLFGSLTLDSVNQSERAATTGDTSSERRNLSSNDSKGRYNPNELSLTLYDKISEDSENYSVLAMFAMQFLKAMNLKWHDRSTSETSGEASSDPKIVENIRARRSSAPVSMARNAYNSSSGRSRVSPA